VFLSHTKVLLVPSQWPEPFGRVAVEALANGIPVVASRTGGLPEAVGDAGILVEDFSNAAAWIAALTELLGTPGLMNELSVRGRQRFRILSEKVQWLKFESELASLLGAGDASVTGSRSARVGSRAG
jgi:glycosyltransferase involved in cell wall biosynthesis